MNIILSSETYAYDIKGKTRVFRAVLKKSEEKIILETNTGLLDGKLIPRLVSFELNQEIKAKKKFYKLISDKSSEGYKTFEVIQENFNAPKYNTNENWDELPMLANVYSDKKVKNLNEYLVQRKYDGVRCLAKLKDGKVILISRGGNYYNIPSISEILLPILLENPNIILDGELYNHDLSFEEISGICRKGLNTNENVLFTDKDKIEYHVYDIINLDNLKEVYNQRYYRIKELIGHITAQENPYKPLVLRVPAYLCSSKDGLKKLHDKFVEEGYEGAIIRPKDSIYTISFRSDSLLKYKEWFEDEFQIIGYEADFDASIAETFVFKLITKDGKTFNCRPKGSADRKIQYYKNINKIIGKFATVKYLDKTNTGLPGKAHVKEIRDYE